jgi:hypothetical protein
MGLTGARVVPVFDRKENDLKKIGVVLGVTAMLAGAYIIGRTSAPTPRRSSSAVPLDAHHRVYCPGHPGAAPGPFVAEARAPGRVQGCQQLTEHDAAILDSADFTNYENVPVALCNENLVELRASAGSGCRQVTLSGSPWLSDPLQRGFASPATQGLNGYWFVDSEGRLGGAIP